MQRLFETCTVDGCGRTHKCRGYCQTHYMQWKRNGVVDATPVATRDRTPRQRCSEAGCEGAVKAKGLCKMHYQRLLRHGHVKYLERTHQPTICSREGCKNWMYASGECHQHYHQRHAFKKYDLTTEQYQQMLTAQGNGCAICQGQERMIDARSGKTRELSVDHSHVTEKVRGILCSNCNRGLGLFGDSIETLEKAIAYLKQHA